MRGVWRDARHAGMPVTAPAWLIQRGPGAGIREKTLAFTLDVSSP